MTETSGTIDMGVMPRRLGEMYANTVVNLVDLLQGGRFELAAKGRNAPDEVLDAVPSMQVDGLLEFIAGLANQFDGVIDMLMEQRAVDEPAPADVTGALDVSAISSSIEKEIDTLQARVDEALAFIVTTESARGFAALGGVGFDLTELRACRDLGSDIHARLDAIEGQIDSTLRSTSRKNISLYIAGLRHTQLFKSSAMD